MIGSLGMPIFFLVVLGLGLNPVLSISGSDNTYLKFIFPGIIAMTIMFTSVFSGIQIIWDKQFGFLKEALVAPVSRTSIMIGQTLGGATIAIIQGLIILVVSLIIGGTISGIQGFFLALVFMILIAVSFTALGIAIASKMEDMHGFQIIINLVIFPIFGLSGALFPLTNAPIILRTAAYIDPLTYGVEGLRYSLLGTSQVNPIISSIVVVIFTVAMIILGSSFFKKIKI